MWGIFDIVKYDLGVVTMDDDTVLKGKIEVEVGSEKFIFKLPSPRDVAKMGNRATAMRREDSPDFGGSEWGLDSLSSDLYRGMALFDILLVSANTKNSWHLSKTDKGAFVIDSSKFPPFATVTVVEAYRSFTEKHERFLDDRSPGGESKKPDADETASSVPDTAQAAQ